MKRGTVGACRIFMRNQIATNAHSVPTERPARGSHLSCIRQMGLLIIQREFRCYDRDLHMMDGVHALLNLRQKEQNM